MTQAAGRLSTAFDRSKLAAITPGTADDVTDGIAGQPYDMEEDITHADMEGLMRAVPR